MKTFSKCTEIGSKLNRILTSRFGRPVHVAVELTLFNKIRKFADGVDFFNVMVYTDTYKGDHTPRFTFILTILNVHIIELCCYNIHHDNYECDIETTKAPYKVGE